MDNKTKPGLLFLSMATGAALTVADQGAARAECQRQHKSYPCTLAEAQGVSDCDCISGSVYGVCGCTEEGFWTSICSWPWDEVYHTCDANQSCDSRNGGRCGSG
jgi:hypothetical protein